MSQLARHARAFKNALGVHGADGTRPAVAAAAVGLAPAVEVMAADCAGPALALGEAGDLDLVANTKNVGADFAADVLFFRDLVHAEFADNLGHGLGRLHMAGEAFGELLDGFGADLQSGIAVFFMGF